MLSKLWNHALLVQWKRQRSRLLDFMRRKLGEISVEASDNYEVWIWPKLRQLEHNLQNVTHPLMQPFARTSAYQYSFFPNTISDWNSLPAFIRSCPSITAFKYNLVAHL